MSYVGTKWQQAVWLAGSVVNVWATLTRWVGLSSSGRWWHSGKHDLFLFYFILTQLWGNLGVSSIHYHYLQYFLCCKGKNKELTKLICHLSVWVILYYDILLFWFTNVSIFNFTPYNIAKHTSLQCLCTVCQCQGIKQNKEICTQK